MKTQRKRGRPPKDEADRKSVDLRIPVTEDQKARIMDAVARDGGELAGWARVILLREAEKQLTKK